MKTILIAGFGDIAERLVRRYTRQATFIGLTRRPERAAELRALGVIPYVGDLDVPATLRRLPQADAVFHFAPPPTAGATDPRTAHLLRALGRRRPAALVYISTSGVYGDCGGAWVAETRTVAPVSGRAVRRVDAERQLRAWGRRQGVAVTILRAPGIYAADRLPLERLRRGDPVLAADEDVHTNHIHAEDLARIACLALFRGGPGRAYNASDDSGLCMGEYFDAVAERFGLARPPRMARAEIVRHLSPLTLSFMSESRRLDNGRLKRELRLYLRYPTVSDGLRAATVPAA